MTQYCPKIRYLARFYHIRHSTWPQLFISLALLIYGRGRGGRVPLTRALYSLSFSIFVLASQAILSTLTAVFS
jgi:hypothetical protein